MGLGVLLVLVQGLSEGGLGLGLAIVKHAVNTEHLNPIERDTDFELLLSRIEKMRGRREYFNLAAGAVALHRGYRF